MLITGALASGTLLAVALRRLDYEQIPQAAVLAATFFVASLVSVPVGPSSVHLLLNGLMGLLLGWTAVPALLVALALQAVFFGFGGLLVLGVNTLNMALPALACAALLKRFLRRRTTRGGFWVGAAAGALGVTLTGLLVATAIGASGTELLPAARVIAFTYLPLAFVEAAVTGATVSFLLRVGPEMLSPDARRRAS